MFCLFKSKFSVFLFTFFTIHLLIEIFILPLQTNVGKKSKVKRQKSKA